MSNLELLGYMASGTNGIDKGINSGLSIGFLPLEDPKLKQNKGTKADPDRINWGKLHVLEASLTPVPALANAGILKRKSMESE